MEILIVFAIAVITQAFFREENGWKSIFRATPLLLEKKLLTIVDKWGRGLIYISPKKGDPIYLH